jgi:hypothetical protein
MANFTGSKYENIKGTNRAARDFHVFSMVPVCNSMDQRQPIGRHLNEKKM